MNVFEELRQNNNPIAIFGAGREGIRVCSHMLKYDEFKERIILCDNYKTGTEKYTKVDIVPADILANEYKNAYVLVCIHNLETRNEVVNQLKNILFASEKIIEYPEIVSSIKTETNGGISWMESEETYDWTIHREQIKKMSEWIDENDKSVIDFGAGECYLKECLRPDVKYIPTDYIARTPEHVVYDFNKDEFPDITADVCVLNQVLYYPENLEEFLKNVFGCAKKKVIIYLSLTEKSFVECNIIQNRVFTSNEEIKSIAKKCNFKIAAEELSELKNDFTKKENGMLFIRNNEG